MSDDLDDLLEISSKNTSPSGASKSNDLDGIQAQIPIGVKFDYVALVYGFVFIGLGFFLLNLGSEGFGVAMIGVGFLGVIAGLATLFWKSPKVKLIQALDSVLIAILLFVFSAGSDAESPFLYVGVACWMLWVTVENVKEYWTLSKMQNRRA